MSTVAVVVPSPARPSCFAAACSSSFEPTERSPSSIFTSRAIVTPSFTTSGSNPRLITTFRPRGPSVTFTAFATVSTPAMSALRASSPYVSFFTGGPCIVGVDARSTVRGTEEAAPRLYEGPRVSRPSIARAEEN